MCNYNRIRMLQLRTKWNKSQHQNWQQFLHSPSWNKGFYPHFILFGNWKILRYERLALLITISCIIFLLVKIEIGKAIDTTSIKIIYIDWVSKSLTTCWWLFLISPLTLTKIHVVYCVHIKRYTCYTYATSGCDQWVTTLLSSLSLFQCSSKLHLSFIITFLSLRRWIIRENEDLKREVLWME